MSDRLWTPAAVGDVAWTGSWIFLDSDDKDDRPVVVVRAPQHRFDLLTVVERTASRFDLRGVEHPPDHRLALYKPGKWVLRFTRTASADLFCEPNIRKVGRLGEPYLSDLLEMWEKW